MFSTGAVDYIAGVFHCDADLKSFAKRFRGVRSLFAETHGPLKKTKQSSVLTAEAGNISDSKPDKP